MEATEARWGRRAREARRLQEGTESVGVRARAIDDDESADGEAGATETETGERLVWDAETEGATLREVRRA